MVLETQGSHRAGQRAYVNRAATQDLLAGGSSSTTSLQADRRVSFHRSLGTLVVLVSAVRIASTAALTISQNGFVDAFLHNSEGDNHSVSPLQPFVFVLVSHESCARNLFNQALELAWRMASEDGGLTTNDRMR